MAATPAADELAAGRVVAGRYRVEAAIGRGGMGRVYRAVDEQLGRAVALKVLAVARDGSLPPEEAARRLMREARAAAAFSHPNVVAIYDVGEFEGAPFIAMELVRGRTLRALVGDTTVAASERLRWLVDVARALGAAHRAGLVHRDVKPDNVIVGDDGIVKLLDFGVARRLPGPIDAAAATERDGTITVEGTLVGTPAYMAPEQLRAEKVDGRADQFAWAVTAYELLSGRKPWPAAGAAELIAAVLSKPAPPLAVEAVPAATSQAIARALAKAPGDRFATMDALVAALAAGGATSPRRNARLLPLAIGAVTALAVTAAVWLARRPHVAAAPSQPALATAAPAAPVAGAPVRALCAPSTLHACGDDAEKPWCNHGGDFLACCPPTLVALGEHGMCGCPKGGSTKNSDCPPPMHSPTEYLTRYLPTATRHATDRCGKASSSLGFDVVIDPDGRVFDAAITTGATADVALQRCMVDALRALELDPPPDGEAKASYGSIYLKTHY